MATIRQAVSALPRAAILRAADSALLQRVVRRYGMRLGAGRFVAGETLDECVAVLRKLNDAGLHANTTLLGEAIPDADGADSRRARVRASILDRLVAEQPAGERRAQAHAPRALLRRGGRVRERRASRGARRRARDLFVRIDMEQSEYVDATLRIYERLRDAGHDNVGTVLQSYLYRTPDDLERLLPPRPNLRIVKGAYLEPAAIAYPEKRDVDSRVRRARGARPARAARTSPSPPTTRRSSGTCRRSPRARGSVATASSSRCSTASGPRSSARSRPRATRCSWRLRSARTGTRTSCAGSPSGPANLRFFLTNLVRR